MPFLLGVDHSRAKISSYDTEKQTTEEHWLNGSQKFSNNVDLLIKEISTKFSSEKVERMVICIDDKCHNAIIENYLSTTSKYGFKNVTLFSTESAIFLKTLHDLNYDAKDKETIAIISDRKTIFCHVFEKNGREFMSKNSFFKCSSPGDDLINLGQLAHDSNNLEDIDNVFLDEIISEKEFKEVFPKVKYQKFMFSPNFSEAALLHAKMNSPSFHPTQAFLFNVQNVLNRKISLLINSKIINTTPIGEALPFMKQLNLENVVASEYKIIERNASGTKVENIFRFLENSSDSVLMILKINENAQFRVNSVSDSNALMKHLKSKKCYPNSDDAFSKGMFYNIPQEVKINDFEINAVGIDLGTSRCFAAVNRRNGIETVALDNTGERQLPSYVSFAGNKETCGQIVVNQLQRFSKYTIFDSKRIIGKMYKNVEMEENWPFKVLNIKNKAMLQVSGPSGLIITEPELVAAVLLKHIKEKCEELQGKKLDEAVITVPASFSKIQRNATMAAGIIAGWEKVHLLPEPIAASLAYFIGRPILRDFTMLLFDFGGGTLDVCVFKIANKTLQIITQNGDSSLGGRDFDNLLLKHFTKILNNQYGIDIKTKDKLKYLLMQKCMEIKHILTVEKSTILDVSDFDTNIDGTIYISSEEFEKISSEIFSRIKKLLNVALSTAKCNSEDIHKVLLVGGSSRIPMIQQLLRKMFPKAEHCCEENPDEVVAIGAAYYSYYLISQEDKNGEKLM